MTHRNECEGLKNKSENGRVSYSIDHASITLRDSDNPNVLETYHSVNSANNSLAFALPECKLFKLVELNVYDAEHNLILIQDDNSIGKPIRYCKPVGSPGSGGPNPPDDDNGGTDVDVTEPIRGVWFDWETATHVSNNTSLPVLPWISSASTGVSREIALDHLREDGWVLMHNSFTLESGGTDSRRYLLFYNKFTGVLRMWYWHEGSNAAAQLKYSIQFLGNTGLLNFN